MANIEKTENGSTETMETGQVIGTEKLKAFWVTEAEEALRVAEHLLEKEDFSYALFFGHLALEKMLKALCVETLKDHAPLIHSLVRLAGIAGITLEENTKNALIMITGFNIESRYPDFKGSFRKKCTEAFTLEQMNEIRRLFKWLESRLK
jgi:HEPN domain-containing protein